MKVLKKGRPQKGWSTTTTCTGNGNGGGGCGAKLLVEESDLYRTANCDYLGDCDYYETFTCPCCGVLTDLRDGLVPSYLARSLPGKSPEKARKEWEKTYGRNRE